MVDMTLIWCAILLMLIVIVRDYLKKKYNINIDNINVTRNGFSKKTVNIPVINKGTGSLSLTMVDAGANKATVMATLRQITGLDYASAKTVVNSLPATFITSISEKEADLTKKALEFVGAKIEIK